MCNRVIHTAKPGQYFCTFKGEKYNAISLDSRCSVSDDYNEDIGKNVRSFGNSDKPGVLVLEFHEKLDLSEFSDSLPNDVLAINFIEQEQATDDGVLIGIDSAA